MQFKEIQLVGFKSFADKTSIKFDEGVTCIVGPNGCGKSNVADAVRWVLGEQSAKTLRGSSMQDVIFNGTVTRRALSYCEVTLVFDNTNRMFDIDYEEVAMTRRLYRSGESEYLLNKQTCRLRDIVELLHGVGIGKEGYSIIGQGKVEQIMNAKPEDRRAIFEEATGVMQSKAQKAESERKLEASNDKLSILVQRLDETEKQLKPLSKQAETAQKYRVYSDQLRYEEVNAYLMRSEMFDNETQRHRAKIERANARFAETETELLQIDADEKSARDSVARCDETLRGLNENLRTYMVNIANRSGEVKVLGERIASARRQIEEATDEIERSAGRTAEIDVLVTESGKKVASLEKRGADLEKQCAQLERSVQEADSRISVYERISDEKRASELSSVENLSAVRAGLGSLEAQKDAASQRIEEVRIAIQKAEAREKDFAAQLAACLEEKRVCEQFLDGKDREEEALQAAARERALAKEKLTHDLAQCNASISNLNNNLELYRGLKNRFEGYRDSVRHLQITAQKNSEIGDKIKGAIADIVSTEAKYEVAIETAFGGAMQNLVTATSDDARYLIEYLKRSGGGVVTFLPVSSMRPRYNSREIERALSEKGALGLADALVTYDPYYDSVIKNLLGNTLICDTIASATAIAKKFSNAFKIVTLDGDTVATSGAMTGGSRRKDSGNFLAGERHIKECEDGIAQKNAEKQKLTAALEACEGEIRKSEEALGAFRQRVQKETANFAALSQRELALGNLSAETANDLTDYRKAFEDLSRRVDDLKSEVISSSENEEVLTRIRTEAAAEANARQAEIEKMKEERDRLSAQLQSLRMESVKNSSAKDAEADAVLRMTEEKQTLLARAEELRSKKESMERNIQTLKQQEEQVALTEEEQREVSAIREQIAATEAEKAGVNERQNKLNERRGDLLIEQQNLGNAKHEAELEISKAEVILENLKQRLDEAYGLSYESAEALRDPDYDLSQSTSRINGIKHSINALGPINQNAEEDFNALNEHYTEMQSQKEDLDKAIRDLKEARDQIVDAMQKQFDKGFQEINRNFTQIFKELFGGGKAEMQLDYTDCEDPLEAGIEIVACPPGKKLTKISLLSGGERAFTAIAILFSILKSRPMPFCILDEIEAALDEANVDRFAKYLKKFSKETQFIVITHRKPTMNQADSLFGVTMEEKGVSKIVSVKLSEVEERLGGDTVI